MSQVWVSSCYGFKTRKPLVEIHYQDTMLQISPEEARDLAGNLMMCAEATEQDAFLLDWFQETMKVDIKQAAVVLLDYRKWRKEHGDPRQRQEDE